MTEPSLPRRSFHKLVTNLSGFVISLATQAMVPRALGPAAYVLCEKLGDAPAALKDAYLGTAPLPEESRAAVASFRGSRC